MVGQGLAPAGWCGRVPLFGGTIASVPCRVEVPSPTVAAVNRHYAGRHGNLPLLGAEGDDGVFVRRYAGGYQARYQGQDHADSDQHGSYG